MSTDAASPVRPATDEEVSLWYCEKCGSSGVLFVKGAGVYEVVEALDREHRAVSAACEAPVGRVRIARPCGWYRKMGVIW